MVSPAFRSSRSVLVGTLVMLSGMLGVVSSSSARPLDTAVADPASFGGAEGDLAFARTRAAGARFVVVQIFWGAVAPLMRPPQFRPEDPADPAYDWSSVDRQVGGALARGLTPVIAITSSPTWAQADPTIPNYGPDPVQYGLFSRAAARRYGGGFGRLPRVRYWHSWNEPNAGPHLLPQSVNGRNTSVELYRRLLNAFVAGVKGAHSDNLVIAGGLSPFRSDVAVSPLPFMRALLCITPGPRPRRTCRAPVRFDIWAHNPYTKGGPSHRASLPGDVSLGDLPTMRRVLTAAVRLGQIRHAHPIGFWVTEFAWESDPPKSGAAPQQLLARWVPEALYRMWRSGVTLVTWFLLRDEAPVGRFGSGLYLRGTGGLTTDQAKPALAAFRFPFVAFATHMRARVWGRLPFDERGSVLIEQAQGMSWQPRGHLRPDRDGIFAGRIAISGSGALRANLPGRDVSPTFPLTPTPDLPYPPFL